MQTLEIAPRRLPPFGPACRPGPLNVCTSHVSFQVKWARKRQSRQLVKAGRRIGEGLGGWYGTRQAADGTREQDLMPDGSGSALGLATGVAPSRCRGGVMDWKQPNVTWQSQGACKGSDPDTVLPLPGRQSRPDREYPRRPARPARYAESVPTGASTTRSSASGAARRAASDARSAASSASSSIYQRRRGCTTGGRAKGEEDRSR